LLHIRSTVDDTLVKIRECIATIDRILARQQPSKPS
jgi:hypothetical protein